MTICGNGHIPGTRTLFRNREEHVERVAGRWKMLDDRTRRRHVVGPGDLERFSIGHEAVAFGQSELAVLQRFRINLKICDAPIGEMGGRKSKIQVVFEKLILRLEMLRSQKHSLRPDDPMPVLHDSLYLLTMFLQNRCDLFAVWILK